MKTTGIAFTLLLSTIVAVPAFADTVLDRQNAARTREIGRSTTLEIKLPGPKYPSCQALISASQEKIFSQFLLRPTSQLEQAQDPECTTNPLFLFAADIMKRAEARARANVNPAAGTTAVDRLANQPERARATGSNIPSSIALIDQRDVISRLVAALDEHQYGTFVRELGLVNGALACSARSSIRTLDLVLAEILAASMEGGLDDEAEQKKCVEGVFNAALNTFDQLQDTGYSLVQRTLMQDIEKARALLYPDYPVCALGIWVYDFTTGKLVQMRDEAACKTTWLGDLFSFRRESSNKLKYRYLNGYLDQFADPRRFGLGYCSEYYVSGRNENFTCDVGLTCKQTTLTPGEREVIDNLANSPAWRELNDIHRYGWTAATSGGKPNPTRFGLPVGVAEEYLCGRSGSAGNTFESHSRGAFGEPGPNDPGFSPSRNFFQCQASTLFATKQDSMTACMLEGINAVAREQKRASMPDGGRGPTDPSFVIGGIKDPRCTIGDSKDAENKKIIDDAEKKDKAATGNDPKKIQGTADLKPEERTFVQKVVETTNKLVDDVAKMIGSTLYMDWYIKQTANEAKNVDRKFVSGLKSDYYVDAQNNRIYYNADLLLNNDVAGVSQIFLQSTWEYMAQKMPVPIQHVPNYSDPVPGRTPYNRDPGFEQKLNSACTSAFDRALSALSQCNTPDRRSQPRTDGRSGDPGSNRPGSDPRVTDPDPQGLGATTPLGSVMQGLLACVDQYGKDIRAMSGAAYGPGGCLPPLTLCNSKDCQTYQTNCTSWGQWQCSFALCREDAYCCGSPSGSRGGGGNDSPGTRTGNAIDCGDGNVWNPAKRKCQLGNICSDGEGLNAGTGFCELLPGIPGRKGPGGDPELGNNRGTGLPRDVGNNSLPGNLPGDTRCPPGTTRQPGGGCTP